jgi:hypothetical protein
MPFLSLSSSAQFRRPRRASQAQRKAARDLGRKRKGKSRDQWRGLALAGAGAVAIGGTALAAHQVQKKREGMIEDSNERLDAAKDAKPEGYKGLSKDQRSRAIEARKAQLFGAEGRGYDEDVGAQAQRISVPSLLGVAAKRSIQEKENTDMVDVRNKTKSSVLGEAIKAEARSGDNRGRTKKAVRRAAARIRPSDFFARLRLARFAQNSSSGDMTMNNYAEFRKRRSSQKHRKAMRDLGRKRKGKSSDKWKGLALAGAAGAAGVAALGVYGAKESMRKRQEAAANTASPQGLLPAGRDRASAGGEMPSSGQTIVPQKMSRQDALPGTPGQRALPAESSASERVLRTDSTMPSSGQTIVTPSLSSDVKRAHNTSRVVARRNRLQAEARKQRGTIKGEARANNTMTKGALNQLFGDKDKRAATKKQVDNWRKRGDYRRSAYRTARFARQSSRSITLDIRYFL